MTDFLPRQNQWSRCHACGYCNHITWHDSNLHSAGTYEVTGCKVCRYRWSKSVLIQSLVNRMKMEFKRESGKNVFGPEEPIKATLELFRSGHCPRSATRVLPRWPLRSLYGRPLRKDVGGVISNRRHGTGNYRLGWAF